MTKTTSTATPPPPPPPPAAAEQEWSEAFGDLDLDNDTQDSTNLHQPPSSSSPTTASVASSDKLNVLEPLWFLRTDELGATSPFANDTKSRVREILSFRVDRSALLCTSTEALSQAADLLLLLT